MDLTTNFVFQPLDNDEGVPTSTDATAGLGPLADLAGNWTGHGFNAIWRPHTGASDHFLELNLTNDQIDIVAIKGLIPNRGFAQGQIFLRGLTYMQQISDANVKVNGVPAGLHIEPGLWINVPPLTDPHEPATVARQASIPHGTTILIQGIPSTAAGGPSIPSVSLTPFFTKNHQFIHFDEQHLDKPTPFRTSGTGLTGITQAMLDNPNSVLTAHPAHVTTTTRLHVSTTPSNITGGGASDIAFLGPNADVAHVAATFWLQKLAGDTEFKRLQYSQIVMLNFNGISWPHITVGTLTKR